MLPATGLYGHICNANLKSLWLFAGFLASLVMVWSMLLMAFTLVAPILSVTTGGSASVAAGYFDRVTRDFPLLIAETLYIPLLAGVAWTVLAVGFHTSLIRAATGARSISRGQAPVLFRLTETLSIAAGIPVPRIEVIESQGLQAYAIGLDPTSAGIVVTRGLLQQLPARELQAVLAHEITHIRNYDARLTVVTTVLQGFLSMLAEFVWSKLTRHPVALVGIFLTRTARTWHADSPSTQRSHFHALLYWPCVLIAPAIASVIFIGSGRIVVWLGAVSLVGLGMHAIRTIRTRRMQPDASGDGMSDWFGYLPSLWWLIVPPLWVVMAFGGFVAALAFALSAWSVGAISRTRWLLADAGAVELTKDADGLIMALARISARDSGVEVDAALSAMMFSDTHGGWLATHPPLEGRIEALRRYAGGTRVDRFCQGARVPGAVAT